MKCKPVVTTLMISVRDTNTDGWKVSPYFVSFIEAVKAKKQEQRKKVRRKKDRKKKEVNRRKQSFI